MKMSSTLLSSPSPKINILFPGSPERTDPLEMNRQVSLALLGVCLSLAAVTAAGGVFSLLSLLRTTRKTPLSVIVASMSVDDLVSLVPLCLFMLQQWDRSRETAPLCTVPLCTLSGLLYVFQGVSSNMKSCLIAVYTFYVTRRCGGLQSLRGVLWGVTGVWLLSLAVSVLPLCGLGSFTPASLGCFPDTEGFYVPLLFSLYSLSLCGMLIFFLPLVHHLLCSREPHRTLYPGYLEITAGPSREGSDALELPPSRSRESWKKSFGAYSEMSPGSPGEGLELRGDLDTVTRPASVGEQSACLPDSPVLFAQKRFSMILAVIRVILWMPMMTLVLVRHAVHARNSSLETLSFILTLLAPAVTPVFVLSERWIHLPCGCFINCRPDPVHEPPAMKRKFQFNLSFQQGYGVYKISHNNTPISPSVEQPSYPNLFNCDLGDTRLHVLDSAAVSSLQAELELRTPCAVDSSSLSVGLEPVNRGDGEALADCLPFLHGNQDDPSPPYLTSHHHREHEDRSLADTSSVFDGPERRLSHEECRKIELTDWEWCRSKSERTPRQRSSGGLAIPLCAFQGTVSLHAPTGKTLSLSTYEVSSDGLKISPNAKKVEVYRSKSVGHEPSADDPSGGPHPGGVCSGGVGVGMEVGMGGVGDTNVKIHLEVLEICDNEEAMDSVSIISNISQSSAHARSPSLRYSRRENRFVSCDLGETASYSLLIPSGGSPEADSLNISIPDTVEAHRMTSRMQTQDSCGYREEIQLLNEAYRKQGGDQEE